MCFVKCVVKCLISLHYLKLLLKCSKLKKKMDLLIKILNTNLLSLLTLN